MYQISKAFDGAATIADLAIGDIIILKSKTLWHFDNRGDCHKGQLTTIAGIRDGYVYLNNSINESYSTSEDISFELYEPQTINIKNLHAHLTLHPTPTKNERKNVRALKKPQYSSTSPNIDKRTKKQIMSKKGEIISFF